MAVGVAACAGRDREAAVAGAAASPPPRPVGTVAMVNENLGFVLVDVGFLYSPPPGLALKTFAPDAEPVEGNETGVLAVGPERERPFVVADVVKGAPSKGDVAYQ